MASIDVAAFEANPPGSTGTIRADTENSQFYGDPRLKIVAGIPAFNESKRIASVIARAKKYVDKVVVCDDGSTDETAKIAKSLSVDVIRHPTNRGYGASLASLFRYGIAVGATVLVTIDADGQHFPEDIPRIIRVLARERSDLVVGSRFGAVTHTPIARKIGITFLNLLTMLSTGLHVQDCQCGLRAYGGKAMKTLIPRETGMGASMEILVRANKSGLKISQTPVRVDYSNGEASFLESIPQFVDVTLRLLKASVSSTSVPPLMTHYLESGILSMSEPLQPLASRIQAQNNPHTRPKQV